MALSKLRTRGVIVITVTMRASYIDKVFKNYASQHWPKKELIIILNNDEMDLADYQQRASQYPNVRVYQRPEHKSLGQCLNFAVRRAKHDYLAKFDDDDYYRPNYLPEAMRTFQRTKADIVGKTSYFLYFPHRQILLLRRKSVRRFLSEKKLFAENSSKRIRTNFFKRHVNRPVQAREKT